jgi:hypothetical protein
MRSFVRPALGDCVATAHGAIAVHGGAAVPTPVARLSWRGLVREGKTETVPALLEQGASFSFRQWTVVRADGTTACFDRSLVSGR